MFMRNILHLNFINDQFVDAMQTYKQTNQVVLCRIPGGILQLAFRRKTSWKVLHRSKHINQFFNYGRRV